ncbi:MAG: hypothetical protein PUE69_03625 [Ruminococcus sp.]|nr:hypothetical protein [Ruminococcus sp.]
MLKTFLKRFRLFQKGEKAVEDAKKPNGVKSASKALPFAEK